MSEKIYFVLILIFFIIVLSRFIVRMYRLDNKKTKNAIFFFRVVLGFLIAMLIYAVIGIFKGQDIIESIFGK